MNANTVYNYKAYLLFLLVMSTLTFGCDNFRGTQSPLKESNDYFKTNVTIDISNFEKKQIDVPSSNNLITFSMIIYNKGKCYIKTYCVKISFLDKNNNIIGLMFLPNFTINLLPDSSTFHLMSIQRKQWDECGFDEAMLLEIENVNVDILYGYVSPEML